MNDLKSCLKVKSPISVEELGKRVTKYALNTPMLKQSVQDMLISVGMDFVQLEDLRNAALLLRDEESVKCLKILDIYRIKIEAYWQELLVFQMSHPDIKSLNVKYYDFKQIQWLLSESRKNGTLFALMDVSRLIKSGTGKTKTAKIVPLPSNDSGIDIFNENKSS